MLVLKGKKMSRPPAMMFYVKDWTQDTRPLSAVTKGCYIDVLCHLHLARLRGRDTHLLAEWAQIASTTEEEMRAACEELNSCGVLRVTFRNGTVTLVSRRMESERKLRLANKLRQAKYREKRTRNKNVTSPFAVAVAVTATTPPLPPVTDTLPPSLQNDGFKTAWREWTAYRTELRKPLKPTAVKRQLAWLAERSADAVAIIGQSIRNNWQGLFDLKEERYGRGGQGARTRVPDGRFPAGERLDSEDGAGA